MAPISPLITAYDDPTSTVLLAELELPPWQQESSVHARDSTSGNDEQSFTLSPLPIAVASATYSHDNHVTTEPAVSDAVQQSVRRMRQRLWDSDRRRRESAALQQLQSLTKTQRTTNNATTMRTTNSSSSDEDSTKRMRRRGDKLSVLESAAETIHQMQQTISELKTQVAANAADSSASSSSASALTTTKRRKRLREDTSSSADTSSSSAATVSYNQLLFSAFTFSSIKQCMWNADSGRVLAVNHAFSAATGWLAEDVIGLQLGPSRSEYLSKRAEDVDDQRFSGQLIRRYGVLQPFNRPAHTLDFKRKIKALFEGAIDCIESVAEINNNGKIKRVRRLLWTSRVEVPADSLHQRSSVVLLHNAGYEV